MRNKDTIKLTVNKDYTISVKVEEKSVETYIPMYINKKIINHKEPTTKNTQDGPIGFSKVKKLTNMLVMLNMKTKETAELVGVSEQVVRNWLLEDYFKDKLKEECRDFSLFSCSGIENKIQSEVVSFDKHGKKVYQDLVVPNDFPELMDSCLYGNCISENIMEHIVSNLKRLLSSLKNTENKGKERNLSEIIKTLLIFEIFTDYLYDPEAASMKKEYVVEDIKIDKGLGQLVWIPLLRIAQRIVARQRVSKAERMQVSYIMKMVEDYMGEGKN
jgi:hypothetical protein